MRRALIILITVLVIAGCVTPASVNQSNRVGGPDDATGTVGSDASSGSLSRRQIAIIRAAREVLETQSTVVGTTTYSYDCSGTILTIYARAGIRLVDLFGSYRGNGVARLYGIARDYGLLHSKSMPEPGDLIFWDNTYDRNEDGVWNDPLTHAGLVLSVSADGQVEYVHHNYRRGIVTARMNLRDPETYKAGDGTVLNSPMRMASQRSSTSGRWLASQLFKEFASMYLIPAAAASTYGEATVASLE